MFSNHHHDISKTLYRGAPLAQAPRVAIFVHGRGASAEDILTLAPHLELDGFALIAPQADQDTWYPYSFMAPTHQNEPGLSSALTLLEQLMHQCLAAGIPSEHIYWLGFSQGACLTLEFAARHARRFGGVYAFSGGLIGDVINRSNYQDAFAQTPVFIGCSDVDPHIPLERVEESAAVLRELGAFVTKRIYPNMPHTIIQDEIELVNALLREPTASVRGREDY